MVENLSIHSTERLQAFQARFDAADTYEKKIAECQKMQTKALMILADKIGKKML